MPRTGCAITCKRAAVEIGLRLGIKKTGCSGFAYVVDYADAVQPDDKVFEDAGVKVVVDPDALAYIDGTEIDFIKGRPQRGVQISQPQCKRRVRLRRKLQRLICLQPALTSREASRKLIMYYRN